MATKIRYKYTTMIQEQVLMLSPECVKYNTIILAETKRKEANVRCTWNMTIKSHRKHIDDLVMEFLNSNTEILT